MTATERQTMTGQERTAAATRAAAEKARQRRVERLKAALESEGYRVTIEPASDAHSGQDVQS